jgi:hypothetical protein
MGVFSFSRSGKRIARWVFALSLADPADLLIAIGAGHPHG